MEEVTRRFDGESDEQPTRRLDEPTPPSVRQHDCPRGHGPMMEVEIHVPGGSGPIELKRPGVWLGWAGGITHVGAYACTKCGHVEFFAIEPSELTRTE